MIGNNQNLEGTIPEDTIAEGANLASKEKENLKKVENFLLDNYHITYSSEVKTRVVGEDYMSQFGIGLHDDLTISINPPGQPSYVNPLERMDNLMREIEKTTGIKYQYLGGVPPKWDQKGNIHWRVSLIPVWK